MRNFLNVALACALCGSICVAISISLPHANAQQTATQSDDAAKSAQVDALLAPFNQPNTPGVAVLVMRDSQIVHRKGYGMARLEVRRVLMVSAGVLVSIAVCR